MSQYDPAQGPFHGSYSNSQSPYTSPPPPPPKTGPQSPLHGPPPLPPPPQQAYQQGISSPIQQHTQDQYHHPHHPQSQTTTQYLVSSPVPQTTSQNSQSHGSQNTPPRPEDHWIPSILADKSKPDLSSLLQSQALLSALIQAPSSTHPSAAASTEPLQNALAANINLAHTLNNLSNDLTSLRQTLTTRLLALHALERQWRLKQQTMDNALEPWSPKALHGRLVAAISEQEALCAALEESFLDDEGRASEREVGEWVRRYREGRGLLALRKERRARFEEGRVGGWR